MKDFLRSRLATALCGGLLCTVGALIPAASAFLIPAGTALIGLAIKHWSEGEPAAQAINTPPKP